MQGLSVLRSPFFRYLLATYAAVLVVTGLIVWGLVGSRLETSLVADLEQRLVEESRLIGAYAAEGLTSRRADLQDEVTRLGREAGVRITLLLPDGRVLADSEETPSLMENHGSRPEVLQAKAEGTGVSWRFSRTLGYSMLYVAHELDPRDGPVGTVRLSLPMGDIESRVASARNSVLIGTGVGLLVALALGVFLARRTTVPLAEITRAAERMRGGEYDTRVSVHHKDEIGILADTLNRMGTEITRRIATISQDDAQLRAMLSAMVEGVVAIQADDRIAFCNRAAVELLDLGHDPMGRSLWEVAPVVELDALIESVRSTGSGATRELELHRAGREQVIVAHASPFEGGERPGLVMVLHDLSDLRRLERIRRDFVANVSHELKTPLASIQGFVETLLDGALHDEDNNVRFLQRIEANVQRLTNLVTDLLSLARIEAHGHEIRLEPVDWRPILREVMRRQGDAAEARGITITLPADGPPLEVLGDPEAMTQVIDNLLDNAVKYTPAPGRVELELGIEDGRGCLRVRDDGDGIPAEDLDRIFERFYRVDKARSNEVGGTGLGLSIVKNLVTTMHGDVGVESVAGTGSCFTVWLPSARG